MKKLNIILLILIIIGLGLIATQKYWVDSLVNYILTFDKLAHSDEDKWSGKVTSVDNSCIFDGVCSLTVEGKIVIISDGFRAPEKDFEYGDISSINDLGGVDKALGKKVSIYAKKNLDGTYTIKGSTAYYIKLISK